MKSILFLMRYPLEESYNLKQKFDGQIQAAVNLGYNVYYLAYDKKSVYLVCANTKTKEKISSVTLGSISSYRSTFGFHDLYRGLRKAINKKHFDIIYMRSKVVGRGALRTFRRFKKQGGKLIVEIPTYSSSEKTISWTHSLISSIFARSRKKLPPLVDLYTIIGAENIEQYKQRPAICIYNGVCVQNYPIYEHKATDEIRILTLASMRYWQGYDRLIEGLANYKGETPVFIEIVGNSFDDSIANWKKLAETLGVDSNVLFRGALYGDELTQIINSCDVAAATLGMHRRSVGVASVLKVREYCARGIPFVYSYNDSCLNGDEPFALKIEENDNPVDIDKLVNWVHSLSSEEITHTMREFAKEKMSWETQLENVFKLV